MSKAVKIIIAIIVIAAIAVAVVVVATGGSDETKDKDSTANDKSASSKSGSPNKAEPSGDKAAAVADVITYNGKGFDPEITTIKAGEAITVTNQSHSQLDFGSDPHPTHTDEPELNAGDIDPGQSKTFTVTKKGTWGFHNHFDPSQHGTIKVQ